MSGYLQRLAQSVMQPTEKIHPVVGSIYAPQPEPPERDIAETSVAVETQRSQLDAPRESEQQEDPLEGCGLALTPQTEVGPSREKHRVPITISESTPTLFRPVSAPLASPISKRSDIEKSPLTHERRDIKKDKYVPLMTPPAGTSDKRVPQLLPIPPLPSRRTAQSADAKRGSRHEPDEIQIHIGRIEVLAVPQTPPPASTKISPTAPSLAHYLRKRDGRAQ